jgi:hypothetical protein
MSHQGGCSLFNGLFGIYIERERLSQLIARLVWASDARPFYESMEAIAHVGGRNALSSRHLCAQEEGRR